ncbi:MAG: GNAT family N-acetyltransferase [Cyclobacteriaceae bacterium]|nr:GNAT family N-acetyltransferase [Cyclobacteriaceae bacterium]
MNLVIKPLESEGDADWCAATMAACEPWQVLGRDKLVCLALVNNPEKNVFVAWIGTKRAGVIILEMRGVLRGYLQAIAVHPDFQSQGLGKSMMKFVEERVFAETPNVFLCVSSFNIRAQKFYAGLGYEPVGTLKNFVIDGHDELILRKTRGPLTQ